MMSKALYTDKYEFTMVDAALKDGTAYRPSVFSVFTRSLPTVVTEENGRYQRRYGIVGGTFRFLELLSQFRYSDELLSYLSFTKTVSSECIKFLSDLYFDVDIDGYWEGDVFFPYSPILNVKGTFAQCTLLETLLLSVLNYDSAVASSGSRIKVAAQKREVFDMGARRVNEDAALAAGRISGVLGFSGTSNVEAARIWGLKSIGTVAHSFVLSYLDERAAFQAQISAMGLNTTFLVDTYDIANAIRILCELTNSQAGAIRIDSGNLNEEAIKARNLLDSFGAERTKIVISGDLDEYRIQKLQTAPIDSYGVGTRFATGSGAPACNFVYKITESADRSGQLIPVGKQSWNKATPPGHRVAYRNLVNGYFDSEMFEHVQAEPVHEALVNRTLLVKGEPTHNFYGPIGVELANQHYQQTVNMLNPELLKL
ncbi:MAG: nicotinate phosphoribosyltransferase [Bifidobacteriaceae bacterium]|jgi:nicotinate phosphoribosyltransferase|nr:nicotinate phosphoribosyltransferase [Bifidobacteriaceae bacterium]